MEKARTEIVILNGFNDKGKCILSTSVIFDYENNIIVGASGKKYTVRKSKNYMSKVSRNSIFAVDGILGLRKWVDEFNNPESVFNYTMVSDFAKI